MGQRSRHRLSAFGYFRIASNVRVLRRYRLHAAISKRETELQFFKVPLRGNKKTEGADTDSTIQDGRKNTDSPR